MRSSDEWNPTVIDWTERMRWNFSCKGCLPGDMVHLRLVSSISGKLSSPAMLDPHRAVRTHWTLRVRPTLAEATSGLFIGLNRAEHPIILSGNSLMIINPTEIFIGWDVFELREFVNSFGFFPTRMQGSST